MADPRFYDNRGPVSLKALCAKLGVAVPGRTDEGAPIHDVAGLSQAGPAHLAFFDGRRSKADFATTRAGWCLMPQGAVFERVPGRTVLIPCRSAAESFAVAARLFYSDDNLGMGPQSPPVHPTARLGEGVVLGAGVVIGPRAEIGRNSRIGPNAVLGRGVTIGRNCEVGANVWIGFAHLGDEVVVLAGARIGAPGFGFTPTPAGHVKVPQLGRVIVQDRVEIGANTTVDRGALGDTVIGEGTKIDNLVQVGHNCTLGRHCVIAGAAGLSGSVTLGDFVMIGGAAGIADHVVIGNGARIAAMSGVINHVPAGQDYGGILAKPIRQWHKESAILSRLAKTRRHRTDD